MLLETLGIGLIIPIITIILNPNQLIEEYNIPILSEIIKNRSLHQLIFYLDLLEIEHQNLFHQNYFEE